MGTSLTGTKPKDTYDSLIKVGDNGPISGTAKVLSDGLGNDLPIAVSTSNVGIGTSSPTGKLTISQANSGGVAAILLTQDESTIQGPSGNTYVKMGGNLTLGAAGVIPIQINTTEVLRVTANGLTFNGDTAAANALDDYEEGTWTPTITFGGASVGITYNFNSGRYVKIGRQVFVNASISVSSKGSSTGSAVINGLPFTVFNDVSAYSAPAIRFNNITFTGQYSGFVSLNSTNLNLNQTTEAGVVSDITDTNFNNSGSDIILFEMSYPVS